jgi:hypothetical protein
MIEYNGELRLAFWRIAETRKQMEEVGHVEGLEALARTLAIQRTATLEALARVHGEEEEHRRRVRAKAAFVQTEGDKEAREYLQHLSSRRPPSEMGDEGLEPPRPERR